MAVNNVSSNTPHVNPNPNPASNARAEAPKPRPGTENLFANDAWFAPDSDLPTVGEPVGNGTGGGPRVDEDGHAEGGRVMGGSRANNIEDDGRGGFGRIFHRMFSGSGSGS